MPRFRIDFVHEGEEEARSAEAEFTVGLKELTFSPQFLDWEEQYYIQHGDQMITTKTIIALEDLPEFGVNAGAVVWRDWYSLDITAPAGEQHARTLLREFKPVWDDKGSGLSELVEILSPPEEWELRMHE